MTLPRLILVIALCLMGGCALPKAGGGAVPPLSHHPTVVEKATDWSLAAMAVVAVIGIGFGVLLLVHPATSTLSGVPVLIGSAILLSIALSLSRWLQWLEVATALAAVAGVGYEILTHLDQIKALWAKLRGRQVSSTVKP